ncbi:unnamed protein product, partial [Timema podura]|nr:unnamed protein product [Timema podura]
MNGSVHSIHLNCSVQASTGQPAALLSTIMYTLVSPQLIGRDGEKTRAIFLSVVASSLARPGYISGVHTPLAVAPYALSSQYHAQDELGQYS